jgi:hypothetical protein
MQPLTDPELIAKFKITFPKENPDELTCLYEDDELFVYKNIFTSFTYLFDSKIDAWLREETEFWRGIALT